MKRFSLHIVLTLVFLFGGYSTLEASASLDPVDVKLTSVFDEHNADITVDIPNVEHGSKLAFGGSLSTLEGYAFAFWVVNGAIQPGKPLDHAFTVQSTMNIQAVFSPDDKHVVLFIDANGQVIDVQFVVDGDAASEPGSEKMPDKPGMIIANPKWDKTLSNITADTIRILQYERDETTQYTVDIINGSGDGDYTFNDLATITANLAPEGEHFHYWLLDDTVVSYESTFTFTVLETMTLEAVYGGEPIYAPPLVTISDALALRTGYHSFRGQFYIPEHFELIEYGMLASDETPALTLDTEGVERFQGTRFTPQSNEYLMSFPDDTFTYARAYLIVRNSQGEIATFYSALDAADAPGETFVENFEGFSTTYADSTPFTGVGGIIWNHNQVSTSNTPELNGIKTQLRNASDNAYISADIPGGVNFFSLMFGKPHSGDAQLEIFINGVRYETEIVTTQGDTKFFSLDNLGITGTFELEIRSMLAQTTVGNIAWAQPSALPERGHVLTLSSYMDAALMVDQAGPFYDTNTELTVEAETIQGYSVSWVDAVTNDLLHEGETYTFDMTKDRHLKAVYTALEDDYILTLTSNIPGAPVSFTPEIGLVHGTEITLTAGAVDGYRFEYFKDLGSGMIFTDQDTFTFYLQDNHDFKAVYIEEGLYDLYLSSNVETATLSIDMDGPYEYGEDVLLSASFVDDHRFVHWVDLFNDEILSDSSEYLQTVDGSRHIVAIYESVSSIIEYETGFEDASKGAYAAGDVTTNDKTWRFDEALIGTLAGDQKHGNRSARIQNGFIKTLFSVDDVAEVSFYYGKYGSDNNSTLTFKASTDGETWVTVESYTATGSFQMATVSAETIYNALGVAEGTAVYFKWDASGNTLRVNVDDIVIHTVETTIPPIPAQMLIKDITTLIDYSFEVFIHYIDIEDAGDAILIQIGDIDILVDSGNTTAASRTALMAFLHEHINDGIIEYIMPSHAHADHIGGYQRVFEEFEIGTIFNYCDTYSTGIANTFADRVSAHAAAGGTVYRVCDLFDEGEDIFIYEVFTDVFLEFYDHGFLESSENSASVAFTLDALGTRAIFSGDALIAQENVFGPLAGDIDILKMGHHGSYTSTGSDYIATINPETVIVNANNYLGSPHGHPHYTAVARIYEYSDLIPVYVIAGGPDDIGFYHQRNGTITVTITYAGYTVSSQYYGDNPIELSKTDYWQDASNAYRHLGYRFADETGIIED